MVQDRKDMERIRIELGLWTVGGAVVYVSTDVAISKLFIPSSHSDGYGNQDVLFSKVV